MEETYYVEKQFKICTNIKRPSTNNFFLSLTLFEIWSSSLSL